MIWDNTYILKAKNFYIPILPHSYAECLEKVVVIITMAAY
jgi:hypothetical protein